MLELQKLSKYLSCKKVWKYSSADYT